MSYIRTSIGASLLCALFGATVWRTWEKDCSASDAAGIWRDEWGRAVPFSVFSASRTGTIVHGMFCAATAELGNHGLMATCRMRSDSGVSPFASALVSEPSSIAIVGSLFYIPASLLLLLGPGNRSLNRSSDRVATSPLMRSSSSSRAEMGGRSRRLLRRLLRGFVTPLGASMVSCVDVFVPTDRGVSNRLLVWRACGPVGGEMGAVLPRQS